MSFKQAVGVSAIRATKKLLARAVEQLAQNPKHRAPRKNVGDATGGPIVSFSCAVREPLSTTNFVVALLTIVRHSSRSGGCSCACQYGHR